jgi:hypothetical protein
VRLPSRSRVRVAHGPQRVSSDLLLKRGFLFDLAPLFKDNLLCSAF